MRFAALLACPYALSSSPQLEVRHAAVELVLSYQHEPEKARAVPGRGTARKHPKAARQCTFRRRNRQRCGKYFNGL